MWAVAHLILCMGVFVIQKNPQNLFNKIISPKPLDYLKFFQKAIILLSSVFTLTQHISILIIRLLIPQVSLVVRIKLPPENISINCHNDKMKYLIHILTPTKLSDPFSCGQNKNKPHKTNEIFNPYFDHIKYPQFKVKYSYLYLLHS